VDATDLDVVMPPEALTPFVRRYIYADVELAHPLAIQPKPTGYMYFVNCFGDSGGDFVSVDGDRRPRWSRWYFVGQIVDHAIRIDYATRLAWIACEFSPTAFYRLFGIPAVRITGMVPPLQAVRPDLASFAEENFRQRLGAPREQHVDELSLFLSKLAERSGAPDPVVERAVAMFEAANGAVRIDDICRAVGVGPRHLNRRFVQLVGIGPKYFGQILQINWVVGLLYFDNQGTLAAIAQEAGFYDQAHFNRAMHRFFREGPREFLKSEHVAFKTFIGASRRFGPGS
jgi:AraC-like DNA-binding protein